MIAVGPLTDLAAVDLRRLIAGYVSTEKYAVTPTEGDGRFAIALQRVPLAEPYRKRYDHLDDATVERYRRILGLGFSCGAFDGDVCVGLALAEPVRWNRTFAVHELHVAESHRGQGIGRRLVDAAAAKGSEAGMRILVCETQTTNAPAIAFYLRTGFHFHGMDLSHYRNSDFPDGEMLVLMKRKLRD